MRSDCVLSVLTEEQREVLFDWLTNESYLTVKSRLAKPPPEGFSVSAHTNTLFRFYHRRLTEIRERDFAELLATSREADDSEAKIQSCFLAASRRAFAHSTYRFA